jgi:hypothetical protein
MSEKIFYNSLIGLAAILFVAIISSCAPVIEKQYVTTELHHDPRPVLPKIAPAELQCLTQQTYQKLYDRQRLITDYAITLEAIIDSTKAGDKNAKN